MTTLSLLVVTAPLQTDARPLQALTQKVGAAAQVIRDQGGLSGLLKRNLTVRPEIQKGLEKARYWAARDQISLAVDALPLNGNDQKPRGLAERLAAGLTRGQVLTRALRALDVGTSMATFTLNPRSSDNSDIKRIDAEIGIYRLENSNLLNRVDSWRVARAEQKAAKNSRKAASEKKGMALFAQKLVSELAGKTPTADELSRRIANGEITIHFMNKGAFKEAVRAAGFKGPGETIAWCQGRDLYVPWRTETLDAVVHEGGHALRNINGTSTFNGKKTWGLKLGDYAEEAAVRKDTREFLKKIGKPHRHRLEDAFDTIFYLR